MRPPTDESPRCRCRRLTRAQEMLDASTEEALAREARAGSRLALDRLVRSHLRLVYVIAREHLRHGCSFDDLFAEGCVGLVVAARRFDPDRGTRFAAYAAWWIRAHVRTFTMRNRRVVAMPSSRAARHLIGRLRPAQARVAQERGEHATLEAVAEALGADLEQVRLVECALSARDVPLDVSRRDLALIDPATSPEEQAAEAEERRHQQESLASALDTLDPREREIIERRVLDDQVDTLANIAATMGVSWQRVRQLEQRALVKLTRSLACAA